MDSEEDEYGEPEDRSCCCPTSPCRPSCKFPRGAGRGVKVDERGSGRRHAGMDKFAGRWREEATAAMAGVLKTREMFVETEVEVTEVGQVERMVGGERKRARPESGSLGEMEGETEGESVRMVIRYRKEGGVAGLGTLKVRRYLEGLEVKVRYVRIFKDGNVMVECDLGDEEKVMEIENMLGEEVKEVVYVGGLGPGQYKGVITGVPMSVTVEQLKEAEVEGEGWVHAVKRLKRGPWAAREKTETVAVIFGGGILPRFVYVEGERYRVREFVPLPVRCWACCSYGHLGQNCVKRRTCGKCGQGGHGWKECESQGPDRCVNCGGGHKVSDKMCVVLRREVEIQKVRVEKRVSYAEAVKVVGPVVGVGTGESVGVDGVREVKEGMAAFKVEVRERMAALKVEMREAMVLMKEEARREMKKEVLCEVEERLVRMRRELVTFVAGVVSVVTGVNSRKEKVKLVVKAAGHHLGLRGLSFDEVWGELGQVGVPVGSGGGGGGVRTGEPPAKDQ